jgi:hypothetical protein
MRSISIGIGYSWSESPVHQDVRWQELRDFCRAAGEHGRNLARASLTQGVSHEEEESSVNGVEWSVPHVNVIRLRGSIGRFTWESICQHIDDSDILVFDLTPAIRGKKSYLSANVWIEIGYALAKPDKAVFLVHSDADGHKLVPSDLRGLLIGHLPIKGEAQRDTSLRMSLASTVRRLAIRRSEDALQG